MKKTCLIYLVIATMILLSACSDIDVINEEVKNEEVKNEEVKNEEVKQTEQAINLKDTIVALDDFSFQVTSYEIVESKNDAAQDAMSIYDAIQDAVFDSTQLGFDIGFNNSKAEVSKRDAYLIVLLKYSLNSESATQRDSIIPNMNISATDSFEDKLILLHDSMQDKYIQLDNPIGVLVFKTYKDSKKINFVINGKKYFVEFE